MKKKGSEGRKEWSKDCEDGASDCLWVKPPIFLHGFTRIKQARCITTITSVIAKRFFLRQSALLSHRISRQGPNLLYLSRSHPSKVRKRRYTHKYVAIDWFVSLKQVMAFQAHAFDLHTSIVILPIPYPHLRVQYPVIKCTVDCAGVVLFLTLTHPWSWTA